MAENSKKEKTIKKYVTGKNRENIICFLLISAAAFFFLMRSPLHPWLGRDSGIDSSVYKTISLMMQRGFMPYKDSFDHKGPLIYLINYLGDVLLGYQGVWMFEYIFLIVTFFLMYKTARLFCSTVPSVITTLSASGLLFLYFDDGNMTEEYAMPFIAAALFIFLDYMKNDKVTRLRLVLCGFSCGMVLMLRPNMIAVWEAFSVGVLVKLGMGKKWKTVLKFLTFFMAGVLAAVLPFIIWLAANGALSAFWDCYITFNSEYSSGAVTERALFINKWESFFFFLNTEILMLSFGGLVYGTVKGKKLLNLTYIGFLLLTLCFISMSGMTYPHYGMVLVPAVIYPLSIIFSELEALKDKHISGVLIALVSLYMFSRMVAPDWTRQLSYVAGVYDIRNENNRSEAASEVADVIQKYTDREDPIFVYGMWDYIYVISDRPHATKYSYIFPISDIRKEILYLFYRQLEKELPKIVVVQKDFHHPKILSFLMGHDYERIWTSDPDSPEDSTVIYYRP
ncbi:MAG: glycosyltransferase family 39 protein [Eubacterium sp.]|nr:glycosyltransferase family 39 protein [Eubacterium sp.]